MLNDEDASRTVQQQGTGNEYVHAANAYMNTVRDVSETQENNELTIVDGYMVKDVIRTDDLGSAMMKDARRVKVESDKVMEITNEEGHGRSSKGAGMDERE